MNGEASGNKNTKGRAVDAPKTDANAYPFRERMKCHDEDDKQDLSGISPYEVSHLQVVVTVNTELRPHNKGETSSSTTGGPN
mmetsp:Transcript_34279/g.67400  ORF Transcript_34279/g.67400 Transcript_34279/m.67400 type:complete len:82 (+) Transcript_34279:521-766(+)